MKRIIILLLLWIPFVTTAQQSDSVWIVNNYTKKEIYITMRDGIKLFTTVYMPKDVSEKHPILLTRTPYSCAPYGEDKFSAFWNSPRTYFMKENYIYVQQDVRGRWMSEGIFEDIRPYNPNKKGTETDEASDTYDTIDWLVKNLQNNNGNVGVFGISYPGFYSTMAALSNHPALKAVSPQAPVTEWFLGDDFHHNGAFMLMDGFAFYSGFGKPRPQPTTIGPKGFDFPTKDNYAFYLKTGALTNFTKLMGDSIKFWKDLMSHPNYDAWWKARDARANVQFISPNIATLVVGGLYDAEDCYGAWNLYKAIEKKNKNNNKIVMGPWYHGQWARSDGSFLGNVQWGTNTTEWYGKNVELPFFNYHLKQKGNIDQLREATIFFSGANEWKHLPKWPVEGVSYESYALCKGGYLSKIVPLIAPLSSWEEYISDPSKPVPYTEDVHFGRTREYMTDDQRFAARRPDVLVFQTEPLENDLTLAGPITADLMVAITGTDADFVVKLIDVFPENFTYEKDNGYVMNGYQMLVRCEVMRGKFRNSFEKPEAFVPNKPTRVKYELPDVAHTFKKGHRLMIQVQSSWFPLVDRNPQQFMDIYQAKDSDFKKATIRVYHNDSKIILPILK
ncbi:MAG: CocE/NonD family hydrolase [Sediminibacterium sp.]|uniref:CocE/NonD family hydrolase n=1 Tax=Sediminibacterium sp. TaxID=1917865 RepID=UPI002ABBBE73|nr:CocE/NonD family hydrolase [Sediminibacterium sp.]MDZ4071484.1 CocE/NonD family hydrolase [Sediminibacterium sp.]